MTPMTRPTGRLAAVPIAHHDSWDTNEEHGR